MSDPLLALLADLEDRFHAACAHASVEDFDRLVSADFWEIGASGRPYDRAFARQTLATRSPMPAAEAWQTREHALMRIDAETYLLTYLLTQPGRLTRRMTLWQRCQDSWQARFHQGTVVLA